MHTSGGTADNRAAVPGAWRSRRLAPVYALVTSLVVAVLLGAVLHEPAPTPTPSFALQFVADEGIQLSGRQVKVLSRGPVDHLVNAEGRVDGITASTPLTVCLLLPRGWSSPVPTQRLGDFVCWPEVDPGGVDAGGRVELRVTRSEGSR